MVLEDDLTVDDGGGVVEAEDDLTVLELTVVEVLAAVDEGGGAAPAISPKKIPLPLVPM